MMNKTLKDYLTEEENKPKRKYISIVYDSETQEKLKKYCEENGFDLKVDHNGDEQSPDDFEFHTTIFYSTTEHVLENTENYFQEEKSVTPKKFEMLGIENNIPVIIVSSDDIKSLREYYEKEYGMDDEWDEWNPHISLIYSKENLPDIETIKLPDFSLKFKKLKIDDIKDDSEQ